MATVFVTERTWKSITPQGGECVEHGQRVGPLLFCVCPQTAEVALSLWRRQAFISYGILRPLPSGEGSNASNVGVLREHPQFFGVS